MLDLLPPGCIHYLTIMLIALQALVGVMVMAGAFLLMVLGMDDETPWHIRWPVIGLMCWGYWFLHIAVRGGHDSPPAIAFGLAVAVVVLRFGRQVRGILDGEAWWPKAKRRVQVGQEIQS
jgi:hypothetical protein